MTATYETWIFFQGVIMTIDGVEYFVPNDPGNIDWQNYQAWLAAGNTPGVRA